MEEGNKNFAQREEEIWHDKKAIYERMEDLRDMARKEKALNLMDDYNKSVKTTKRLMNRYRELEENEFYKKKSKNGEIKVDVMMINEASEVTMKRDERWKYLGNTHKMINEIKKELKKEMNTRDRHQTIKILDRYTS